MRFFFLFFSFFSIIGLFTPQSLAQTIHRELDWKIKHHSDRSFLVFNNAIYQNNDTLLPEYFEIIPLPYFVNSNFHAELKNIKYAKCNEQELKILAHLPLTNQIIDKSQIGTSQKQKILAIQLLPIRKNSANGSLEKVISFDVVIHQTESKTSSQKSKTSTNSVLKTGNWVKFGISKSGVYSLTYSELNALGIANPENVRLFGNSLGMLPKMNKEIRPNDLIENKIMHTDQAIFFYAKTPHAWKFDKTTDFFSFQTHSYSSKNYYFLTSDAISIDNNNILNEDNSSLIPNQTRTDYLYYEAYEKDSLNLIRSGQLWFSDIFDIETSKKYNFDLSNIINNSLLKLNISLAARSPIDSYFQLAFLGTNHTIFLTDVSFDYEAKYAELKQQTFDFTYITNNDNSLVVNYIKPTASATGWLDKIEINARKQLLMTNSQMHFRDPSTIGDQYITQFQISNSTANTIVWDITTASDVKQITTKYENNKLIFNTKTDDLREFIVFDKTNSLQPDLSETNIKHIENQNLHEISNVDMLLITPKQFLSVANNLAVLHTEQDGLKCLVVELEQIYNEFSSGTPDVTAIRDFTKYVYEQSNLKYLLLIGDGSYDNQSTASENSNFLPTYQSIESLSPTSSFVTDDFFGLLDDDEGESTGFLDIGIGRLPIQNTMEGVQIIEKITNY